MGGGDGWSSVCDVACADLAEALRRVGEGVLVTTAFGAGFGALLAYMRAQNVLVYSVSMGANYAIFSGTFFGACAARGGQERVWGGRSGGGGWRCGRAQW
jgi:hypothetical protein